MRILGVVLFVLYASVAFGSATIVSGVSQNVSFDSTPKGAKVLIDGVSTCITPCTVSLPRKYLDQTITFEKKGYTRVSIPLVSTYNPVIILSIVTVYSSTTDFLSRAAWRYSPNSYYAELVKEEK